LTLRLSTFTTFCCLLCAIFAFTAATPTDVSAAARKTVSAKKCPRKASKKSRRSRRSSCSPAARAQGRVQAMELLRTQSPELCRMVGIEPAATAEERATALSLIQSDGEADDAYAFGDEGEDIAELEREDDVTVDVEAFRSLWLNYVDDGGNPELTAAGIERQRIVDVIMNWLGARYHFGGHARTGIDCSAFTRTVYGTVASIELPRTAASQISVGSVVRRNDLQFGDLVFFHTRKHARVSHVGIYIGDNLFAHASSRFGVTVSSLESTYYSKRLLGARRLTDADIMRLAVSAEQAPH
jgi:hypothetical protein